jgi:hypothetical protein
MTNGAVNFSGSTASIYGVVTSEGSSPIIKKGVCWGVNPDPTITNDNKTMNGGSGSFTVQIEGLVPKTTYYYRLFATNSEGTSYTPSSTFTVPLTIGCSYAGGIVFQINNDGTGLIVSDQEVSSGATRDQAISLCSNFSNNGFGGWYLPSILELDSVYKKIIKGQNTPIFSSTYWSKTQNSVSTPGGKNYYWMTYNMNTGIKNEYVSIKDSITPRSVIAVRKF